MKQFVIAGIGTEIGKTFISAILVEALQADYWKPVQAGSLDYTDTDFLRRHVSNDISEFHPEAYRLTLPMSPHASAAAEGISIALDKLTIPRTENNLIIELAGGLMVPLNGRELNADLLKLWDLPVILVSRNYLGSINHTLLSFELLKKQGIRIPGIIFNGDANAASEEFILQYSGLPCIARISMQQEISKQTVKRIAADLKEEIQPFLNL